MYIGTANLIIYKFEKMIYSGNMLYLRIYKISCLLKYFTYKNITNHKRFKMST